MKNTTDKEIKTIKKKIGEMLEKIMSQDLVTMLDLGNYVEEHFTEREKTILLCNDFKNKWREYEQHIINKDTKSKENNVMFG